MKREKKWEVLGRSLPHFYLLFCIYFTFVCFEHTIDIAVESSCIICDTGKSESDLEKLLDNLKYTMGNEKLQDVCSDHTSKLLDCVINLRNVAKCNRSIEGIVEKQ